MRRLLCWIPRPKGAFTVLGVGQEPLRGSPLACHYPCISPCQPLSVCSFPQQVSVGLHTAGEVNSNSIFCFFRMAGWAGWQAGRGGEGARESKSDPNTVKFSSFHHKRRHSDPVARRQCQYHQWHNPRERSSRTVLRVPRSSEKPTAETFGALRSIPFLAPLVVWPSGLWRRRVCSCETS